MQEGCLRTARQVAGAMTVIFLLFSLPGCGNGSDNMGEVGFILIGQGDLAAGGDGIRGLDRTKDAKAECEVLKSRDDTVGIFRQTVDVDKSVTSQDVSSGSITAGKGYFARIRGMDDTATIVYECGISGPFDLQGGHKFFLTVYLNTPAVGDTKCDTICTDSSQCPSGNSLYCLSNYPNCDQVTQTNNTNQCVKAQCLTNTVGNACTSSTVCGPSFTCAPSPFVDGYCTTSCSSGQPCPPNTFCTDKTYTGALASMCVKTCTTDADCRTPKYSCKPISADAPPKTGCLPT